MELQIKKETHFRFHINIAKEIWRPLGLGYMQNFRISFDRNLNIKVINFLVVYIDFLISFHRSQEKACILHFFVRYFLIKKRLTFPLRFDDIVK